VRACGGTYAPGEAVGEGEPWWERIGEIERDVSACVGSGVLGGVCSSSSSSASLAHEEAGDP
jgi:hypothetical protein